MLPPDQNLLKTKAGGKPLLDLAHPLGTARAPHQLKSCQIEVERAGDENSTETETAQYQKGSHPCLIAGIKLMKELD